MTEKKRSITLAELNQIVAEQNMAEEAKMPDLDQARERRMAELREKYPGGLRAREHPSKRPIRARYLGVSRRVD